MGYLAKRVINVTIWLVKPRIAAEDYLARRREDPVHAASHDVAPRRIAMFDEVVESLDSRREKLGMTKAELARRSDLPPAAIRRLFSQRHKNPTLTTLAAIAEALDLRLSLIPSSTTPGKAEAPTHTVAARLDSTETSSPSGIRRRTA